MANFQGLYEFVDRAVKNRKYPQNTALGLKAALKLFEAEVHDEERDSIAKFEENIDQIYHAVSSKNKDITASSLATYKSRVLKVLRDYNTYGIDPTKMNGWVVKLPVPRQKRIDVPAKKTAGDQDEESAGVDLSSSFVFDFRGGIKLVVPRNQKTSDAIADGELKVARQALSKFADEFMSEPVEDEKDGDAA